MDGLADNNALELWLLHYGSFALFFLLALGIIALPVPEETLMVIAGALMSHERLPIPHTFVAALLGSMCGITVSYMLGRTTGHFLLHRYGKWLGVTEKHLEKAHGWFERFGTWALFIGYFIPGVRHFTGFSAGTAELDFRKFAIFAYSGAFFWVSTFLLIGYFFGDFCHELCDNLELNIGDVLSLLFLGGLVYLIYLVNRK